MDAACQAIGRNAGEIRRSAQISFGGKSAETIDTAARYYEAGFTELVVMVGPSGWSAGTNDPVAAAEIVAEKVLPEIRKLEPGP